MVINLPQELFYFRCHIDAGHCTLKNYKSQKTNAKQISMTKYQISNYQAFGF